MLCLQQHKAIAGEEFDSTRTGGDHLGFEVDSRAELEEWVSWFRRNGVTHAPIVDADYVSVLMFKDPDRFQLEMFYRPNRLEAADARADGEGRRGAPPCIGVVTSTPSPPA